MASVTSKHTMRTSHDNTDPKDHAQAVATLTACSAADGGWFEVYVTSAFQIDVTTVDGTAISITPAADTLPYRIPFKVKTVEATSIATYIAVR